jgi:hypothetical protein
MITQSTTSVQMEDLQRDVKRMLRILFKEFIHTLDDVKIEDCAVKRNRAVVTPLKHVLPAAS